LNDKDRNSFVFVEFSAWLYQGFDYARAALMEVRVARYIGEPVSRAFGLISLSKILLKKY